MIKSINRNLVSCTILITLLATLFSCNKKDKPGSGQFMVVHTSPGLAPIDVYVDGNKLSTSPVAYTSTTGYQPLIEGTHQLKITTAGSSASLIEANFGSVATIKQSVYVFNRSNALEVFLVADDVSSPGSASAGIRFFHLSPGAPMVDMGTVSGTAFTPLFTARSFETRSTVNSHSSFITISPGTYKFNIRVNGAGTSLHEENITVEAGKSYTIYAKGIAGDPLTPLGFGVVAHNQ
jgi:hypothetical protein